MRRSAVQPTTNNNSSEMGGGDLNLKKSWHPHTLKNQERVWKAEQEKKLEEGKLRDLRKEIEYEKSREDLRRHGESSGVLGKRDDDKKMDWMYKNSTELINRDEYLLGRTIDKSFETLQAEEQNKAPFAAGAQRSINHVEHECIPYSIRSYRTGNNTEQVDIQRKRLEDPLVLIKEREMESRRKLLENPVRLKELHRILKQDLELRNDQKPKKSKKSKKSKKKHKKRSKSESADEGSNVSEVGSSSDLDERLAKKYNKLKSSMEDQEEHLGELDISKLLDAKYETISKELDKIVKSKKKRSQRSSSADGEKTRRHKRPSASPRRRNRDGRDVRQTERKSPQRQRSRSPQRQRSRSPQRQRSRSPQRQRSRSPHQRFRNKHQNNWPRRRTRSKSPAQNPRGYHQRAHSPAAARTEREPPKAKGSKLTEEEKEARRREMMENAAWRESDRSQAVQKHRDAYAREEEQNKGRDFDKDFINQQVKKAISNQTSVGSRIRANLNNIQRTSSSMNSNFARK